MTRVRRRAVIAAGTLTSIALAGAGWTATHSNDRPTVDEYGTATPEDAAAMGSQPAIAWLRFVAENPLHLPRCGAPDARLDDRGECIPAVGKSGIRFQVIDRGDRFPIPSGGSQADAGQIETRRKR